MFHFSEEMLAVPKLYVPINTCMLRVINNDTEYIDITLIYLSSCREVFHVSEEMLAVAKLYVPINTCMLCVINNDTK